MSELNLEKLKQDLERETALRISAEQKLEDSKSAFYNAIDQLRAEKNKAETDSKAISIDLEEFGRFSDQSPYPTLRISKRGDLLYANKKAQELISKVEGGANEKLWTEFFDKMKMARSSRQNQTGNFNILGQTYHLTFAPHENNQSVNIFAVDISEQERLRKYFEVLSAYSTALLDTHDQDSVAWTITKQAIAKLGYVDCVVYLKDPISGKFIQRAAHGMKNPRDLELIQPLELKPGEGIVGHVAQTQKGEYVNDVSIDKRYVAEGETGGSEIAIPIIVNGETFGVIDSEHPNKNHYTDEDLSILTAISSATSTRLQRIEALKSLRKEEEQFKGFVENAFGGLYILRQDRFEYVNHPLCEILGYEESEILDPEFDFLDMVISSNASGTQAIIDRESGDTSPKSYKMELKTKSGETRHLAINTTILEDERGPYTLGIALDITAFEQSRTQLNAVNHELEKRNSELGQFAHLASHNLRAPVTNLSGLLEHYNRDNPLDETNAFIVKEFENSVKNLHNTLEEMHEVLQVRADQNNKFYKVNLADSLGQVTSLIKEQITKSGAIINHNFEVEEIQYVKSHVENIMLNMITNSIKYANPNENPLIEIKAYADDEFVKIIFQDNGLGINLDRHGKDIFGMYKRFHNHPDSRGLGLYLVKTQLDTLGGEITVDSEIGKGTAFTVALRTK